MQAQLVQLTQQLIAFRSVNPPGDEEAIQLFLAQILSQAGFEVQLRPFAPGRSNLIAQVRSADKQPPLVMTGHVDVVPLGGAPWSKDPFAGEIMGDRLYGRGSSDMKSGIASMVLSALEANRRYPHELDLMLVVTGGEELNFEGVRSLMEQNCFTEAARALLVCEPTSNAPEIGHKGNYWLQARAKGITAHGSMPHLGENAIYKLAEAILILKEFDFQTEAHPFFTGPTLNIGNCRGGLNINSVPDSAECSIDIRTLPNMNLERLLHQLQQEVGERVELSLLSQSHGVISDPKNPWIQEVFRILQTRQGATPPIRTGVYATDAGYLKQALGNPPTLILGPGEAEQAHRVDEYCSIRRLVESFEIYLSILSQQPMNRCRNHKK